MGLNALPQKEADRKVYLLIKEGKIMTAAELREKTGYTKGQIQSCLMRLYYNGYITTVSRDRKKANTWKVN